MLGFNNSNTDGSFNDPMEGGTEEEEFSLLKSSHTSTTASRWIGEKQITNFAVCPP